MVVSTNATHQEDWVQMQFQRVGPFCVLPVSVWVLRLLNCTQCKCEYLTILDWIRALDWIVWSAGQHQHLWCVLGICVSRCPREAVLGLQHSQGFLPECWTLIIYLSGFNVSVCNVAFHRKSWEAKLFLSCNICDHLPSSAEKTAFVLLQW